MNTSKTFIKGKICLKDNKPAVEVLSEEIPSFWYEEEREITIVLKEQYELMETELLNLRKLLKIG